MRTWVKRAVLIGGIGALSGVTGACYTDQYAVAYGSSVSFGVFYDALTPYGSWVYTSRFGRVWQPYATVVGPGFVPYATGGQWMYTDYGWTWDSFWDWGWAPFHYGRWFLDPVYGWVWIPGNLWGPAWVDWRFGGGYIGWAPLPPAGFALGFGAYWAFVPVHAFYYPNPVYYAVPPGSLYRPWNSTRPVGRTVTYGGVRLPAGPAPQEIVRVGGRPVPTGQVTPPTPGVVQPARPVASGPRYQPPAVAGQNSLQPSTREGQAPPAYRPPGTPVTPGTPGAPGAPGTAGPTGVPTYQPPRISSPPTTYPPAPSTAPPISQPLPSAPPPTYHPPSVAAPPPTSAPPPSFTPPPAAPPPSFSPPPAAPPPAPPPAAPPPAVHPGVPVSQAPPPPNPPVAEPESRPPGPRLAQGRVPSSDGSAKSSHPPPQKETAKADDPSQ